MFELTPLHSADCGAAIEHLFAHRCLTAAPHHLSRSAHVQWRVKHCAVSPPSYNMTYLRRLPNKMPCGAMLPPLPHQYEIARANTACNRAASLPLRDSLCKGAAVLRVCCANLRPDCQGRPAAQASASVERHVPRKHPQVRPLNLQNDTAYGNIRTPCHRSAM